MKVIDATFRFADASVRFKGDMVFVTVGAKRRVFKNAAGEWGGRPWKPRVADCLRLIEAVRDGRKQRRTQTRNVQKVAALVEARSLRLFSEESDQ